mmetsp:Transcript_35894/g.90075  ORF Transcript_35894/g.90075 Transcript_35894/m.90075 type:complete len:386 (-) Transcript_35894:91-1248(-)|eukprot:CAMPEP_0177640220 /NCGR_PEP_ID=MMETSP0447-20121125/6429_1 /TAXON_ID=0 /ORGANISM="Stygamoeba regulata, Strain BSH-02190019" /LENGTH=385 /DNA_ID=CAMNT_0019142281 /DNA_START=55 /DNA_END=1212 /DNA_ORIENTATION=+
MHAFGLFFVLLVALAAAAPAPHPPPGPSNHYLDSERVGLVDHNGYNWLFRGNMPKNSSEVFAYDELISVMRTRADGSGLSFPDEVDLFVISLNSLYNQPDTDIEISWFNEHPETGVFENWSFYHRYPNPYSMSDEEIKSNLADPNLWGKDDYINRTSTLMRLFEERRERPLAIYFHCETGCDRTGEMSAAYLMTKNQMSLQDSDTFNKKWCGRNTNPSAQYTIGWYCFYLTFNQTGFDPCCKCSGPPVDYSKILYLAAFLTDDGREVMRKAFPPHLENVFIDHMTIAFKPQPFEVDRLEWGKEVFLQVKGYGNDQKAEAVVVEASEDLKSDNPITHVTISTAKGVGAVWSNNMLANGYTPVQDGVRARARVGASLLDGSVVYDRP